MQIEILDFIKEDKGFKIGIVDIKVTYSIEKWEIFRGLAFFEKEDRRWLSWPNVKRTDDWFPRYERKPPIDNDILNATLELLKNHIQPPSEDLDDELLGF